MLRSEREDRIVSLLAEAESGLLRVKDLSASLGVSQMTIRRDLESLEERGLVRRVRGGAMHMDNALLFEKSFRRRGREFFYEKIAIGRAAAAHVKDGDVIILDAGTTTLQVARHIRAQRVTAVTNALPVAAELAARPSVSSILLGGNLKGPELCTVGPMVSESLAEMAADTLFLSAAGFSPERGLMDPDMREAAVKRSMIQAARRVILVADSSKYQAICFAHIAPIGQLDLLITDTGLSDDARRALAAAGVRLELVEPGPRSAAKAAAAQRERGA
jgi:DeoR family fructose operon transcriptional repressor